MLDLSLGGPAAALAQAAVTAETVLLNYLERQLELAGEAERAALLQQKIKRLKRLNFYGDKIAGIFGYKDEEAKDG